MKNFKNKIFQFFLIFSLVWVSFALSFDVYMLYLNFSNQNQKILLITNSIDKTFDKIR